MMPVMMETIADELGLEAAEKLADVLGGHEITIPAVRSEGSSLSEIVGEPIAAVLIENYGGGRVTIPSWKSRKSDKRRQLILDNENLSVNELVTMTGLSSRQVRRIRTKKNAVTSQQQWIGYRENDFNYCYVVKISSNVNLPEPFCQTGLESRKVDDLPGDTFPLAWLDRYRGLRPNLRLLYFDGRESNVEPVLSCEGTLRPSAPNHPYIGPLRDHKSRLKSL